MAAVAIEQDFWPLATAPTGARDAVYSTIGSVASLRVYNILNGGPQDIQPYLQRATVPEHLKWVSVGGVTPQNALRCMDAFIKVHKYHIMRNQPADWTAEKVDRCAFILGVTRCVMTSNYNLRRTDMIVGEVIDPYLNLTNNPGPGVDPTYVVTVEVTPQATVEGAPETSAAAGQVVDAVAVLTGPYVLTEERTFLLQALVRSAQAIPPVQGYNLMVDGHHYLSDPEKPSFKAFLAVENQLWQSTYAKRFLADERSWVRDILWHKAGHPILPSLKMRAATTGSVATNLRDAGVGSAAARLPAMESEVRAVGTYRKLTEAIKPTFESFGGAIDNRVFYSVIEALNAFPVGLATVTDNAGRELSFVLGGDGGQNPGVQVRNRAETIAYAVGMLGRGQEAMAMCFGFYCQMVESSGMMETTGSGESLRRAFSLKKLKDDSMAQYVEGVELYRDYKSYRQKMRADGLFKPPELVFF